MLSNEARKTSTVGQMINLIAVNVQSFNEFPNHMNQVWSCALSIIVAIFIISIKLNVIAALAGLLTMALFVPMNSYVSNRSKKLQAKKLKVQDSRIKTINEILNGIKVCFALTLRFCFFKENKILIAYHHYNYKHNR